MAARTLLSRAWQKSLNVTTCLRPRQVTSALSTQSGATSQDNSQVGEQQHKDDVTREAFDNSKYVCHEYYNHDLYAFFEMQVEVVEDRVEQLDNRGGKHYKAHYVVPPKEPYKSW